ncbi:MAG: type I secretion system permease/ATPase [Methylobacterium sp.]
MTQSAGPLGAAVRSFRTILTPVLAFSTICNILAFAMPIYMIQVYDRVLFSRSVPTLVTIAAITVALLVFLGVFDFLRSRILVRAGLRFDELIARPLFERLATPQRDPRRNGKIRHLRDADQFREFLTGSGLVMFLDAPWAPLFILLCWMLHPALGLTALVGALVVLGLALVNERATRRHVEAANQASSASFAEAALILDSIATLRPLGMGTRMMERWKGSRDKVLAAQTRANDISGGLLALSKFARMLLQLCLISVGAYLTMQNQISGGSMFAASLLMGRALGPVEQAVANWKPFLEARAAYRRLNELFDAAPAAQVPMDLPVPKGVLSVENVTVADPATGRAFLNNVSFTLAPGSILALAGHSGAGKSTLIRAVVGAIAADRGTVRVDGFALDQWNPDVLGRHVGYVAQEIVLYPGTVAENIARMAEPDGDAVIEAAGHAGLHELIQKLPEGYATKIGPGGVALSGGIRQRVALARALYGNPCLVILDEPNAHLDAQGEACLIRAINGARARGAAVLFSAHKTKILAIADSVLTLANGTVKAQGQLPSQPRLAAATDTASSLGNPQDLLHAAVHQLAS